MLTIDKIYHAKSVLKGVTRLTDIIKASNLDAEGNLFLKTENLQVTGSFKIRGSYYKMTSLTAEERAKGVVASSAGNHAQGVALAAQKNNIPAKIFIPSIAPISKIEATRGFGAEVELIDGVYDDAYAAALLYAKNTGATLIHPFDDDHTIAGQGTIGLEILDQLPDVDAVITAVGGGGLLSGVGYAIKQIKPSCKVYGVQSAGADSMARSFKNGKIESHPFLSTFADGIAVKTPGSLTYEYCKKYADDIVTVTDEEIAAAILALMERQKLVSEGAGAAPVAAAMFHKLNLKGKTAVAVISGGNIDVNILSRVINRGLQKSGRLSEITLKLVDKPGQLQEVSAIIAKMGANVIKVRHNLGVETMAITSCLLHISMETKNHAHFAAIKTALKDAKYEIYKEEF